MGVGGITCSSLLHLPGNARFRILRESKHVNSVDCDYLFVFMSRVTCVNTAPTLFV